MGVREPVSDARETGRGIPSPAAREGGRAYEVILARELGLLISSGPPRFGNGPNDRRLTPDVLSRGTWLPLGVDVGILVGVGSSPATEDAAEPLVRLRERIVIDAGILVALYTLVLGEARGGVRVGPGSLDRAECTRASSRCICAVRVRIWVSEFEVGSLFEAERGPTARWAGVRIVVVPPVEIRLPGARVVAVGGLERGLGVVLALTSAEGRRERLTVLRWAEGLEAATLGRGAETSDMGGEGGSGNSERVSPSSVSDLESVGVVMRGELAVEPGEAGWPSKVGDARTERSVEMVDKCLDSCFLILSWRSSASILRSPSSSRRRCDSIRSCSRSCSPILISSSIITALSIAWLYLDSMSSKDDVVLRACRSKSSLATSISLSFNCKVRFVSRRVVISFSSAFWDALASVLDSLYFLCITQTKR
jgi:hypothetical protein